MAVGFQREEAAAKECVAELERQIAAGEIPAEKVDEFRHGLEIQMADEGRVAAKRRSSLTRALKALA